MGNLIDQIGTAAASGLEGAIGSIPGALLSGAFGLIGQNQQVKHSKELMDYQWEHFNSPQAQVKNMTAAGLSPVAALGEKGSFASPSASMPGMPVQLDGISEVSNYIKSLADAKKAGADVGHVKAETDKAIAEADSIKFQNELNKRFGNQKWILDLKQAYQNLKLALQTEDLNEQQKAFNEWHIAGEKALSQANEYERDILQKKLENTDTELQLSNDIKREQIKTEKSHQSANYASAANQRAQALVNKEIQAIKHVEREVAETGKLDQIDKLLADYRRDKMLSDEEYEEAKKRFDALKRINHALDKSEFVSKSNAAFTWLTDILGAPFKGLTSNLGK